MEKPVSYQHIKGTSYVILFIVLLLLGFMVMAKDLRAAGSEQEQYKTITIKKGDTLWSIADEYEHGRQTNINGFVEWVERANHINRNHIEAGQDLVIPIQNS